MSHMHFFPFFFFFFFFSQKLRHNTMNTVHRVGVQGASGHVGRHAVEELKKLIAHENIVAISRTPEKLADLGVETREGDFDHATPKTYAGLFAMLFIPTDSLAPGIRTKQTIAGIDAALAGGVEHIVFLGLHGGKKVDEPHLAAAYFHIAQHVRAKSPAWTILNMTYFADTFAEDVEQSLERGVQIGIGDAPINVVSRRDVGAAAAAVLAQPEKHDGAHYIIAGPAALTGTQRAAIASTVTKKPLLYTALSEADFRGALAGAGLPEVLVNAIATLQSSFAESTMDVVSGDVQKLTGRPPQSLEEVLADIFKKSKN